MLLVSAGLLVGRSEATVELAAVFGELAGGYRGAHLFHEAQDEAQVVYRRQPICKKLLRTKEVMHIRCRECAAGVTVAVFFDGRVFPLIERRGDIQSSCLHEQRTVARYSRGQHAVEHIYTTRHAFHQVFRRAYAHEVAGRVEQAASAL